MSTKISYESIDGNVTVETPEDGITIWDVRDSLLKPMLLAAGYSPRNVDALFGEGHYE